ncbi:hypothetical protein [Halobacillus andaensis]|uniref:hypothetical protein n=1 Tax=Halobacillus andaensis TaxID=1176239 RepID=UPI003D76137F
MKIILLFYCISLFLWINPATTEASTTSNDEEVNSLMNHISTEELEQNYDQLQDQYGEYMPKVDFKDLSQWGEEESADEGWLTGIVSFLFHELLSNGKLFRIVVVPDSVQHIIASHAVLFLKTQLSAE